MINGKKHNDNKPSPRFQTGWVQLGWALRWRIFLSGKVMFLTQLEKGQAVNIEMLIVAKHPFRHADDVEFGKECR